MFFMPFPPIPTLYPKSRKIEIWHGFGHLQAIPFVLTNGDGCFGVWVNYRIYNDIYADQRSANWPLSFNRKMTIPI